MNGELRDLLRECAQGDGGRGGSFYRFCARVRVCGDSGSDGRDFRRPRQQSEIRGGKGGDGMCAAACVRRHVCGGMCAARACGVAGETMPTEDDASINKSLVSGAAKR